LGGLKTAAGETLRLLYFPHDPATQTIHRGPLELFALAVESFQIGLAQEQSDSRERGHWLVGADLSAEVVLKPKRTRRADTYALKGGGFLHIDKVLVPIERPPISAGKRLGDSREAPLLDNAVPAGAFPP
jgi:hypothetical protein